MLLTIKIFSLFIDVYDVTYAEIQFNHSILCNFISLWKIVKATTKLYYRRCFLHESNKKCKENQWWHTLCICEYDVTYAEYKTV